MQLRELIWNCINLFIIKYNTIHIHIYINEFIIQHTIQYIYTYTYNTKHIYLYVYIYILTKNYIGTVFITSMNNAYNTGRLLNYLLGYCSFFVVLMSINLLMGFHIFNLHFHFHHYCLALFLWPLTCFKNRFSCFCQSLLLGLFINGIAAWGFDSIWVDWIQSSFSFSPQLFSAVLVASCIAAWGFDYIWVE